MATTFTIPTVFSAIDRFSAPVDEMSKRMQKFGDSAQRISIQTGIAGLAILYPIKKAVDAAVELEDKVSGIGKIMDFSVGTEDFERATSIAQKLGVNLSIGSKEAAGLMEALAPGANKDLALLEQYAKVAGEVAVAFGMTGFEAGESFIGIKSGLKMTTQEAANFMGVINEIGNNVQLATSDKVLRFFKSGGVVAASLTKASGELIASMGATLMSLNITPSESEAGTIIERFAKKALNNPQLNDIFNKAGGGDAGIMAIMEKGMSLPEQQRPQFFKRFAEYGGQIQALAEHMDDLKRTIAITKTEQANYNSVVEEFLKKSKTGKFTLDQLSAVWGVMSEKLGTLLIPLLVRLAIKLIPIIERIISFIENNKKLVKWILVATAALGAFLLAVSAISAVVVAFIKTWQAIVWIKAGIMALTASISGMGAMIFVILAPIALIISAIAVLVSYWNEWGAAVTLVAGIALAFTSPFLAALLAIVAVVKTIYDNWEKLKAAFTDGGMVGAIKVFGAILADALLYPLQQFYEKIYELTSLDLFSKAANSVMWTRVKNWSEATGKEADVSILGNTKVAQNNMLTQSINGSVNGNIGIEVKNSSGNDVNVNDGKETTSIKPGVASTMKIRNMLSDIASKNGFAF